MLFLRVPLLEHNYNKLAAAYLQRRSVQLALAPDLRPVDDGARPLRVPQRAQRRLELRVDRACACNKQRPARHAKDQFNNEEARMKAQRPPQAVQFSLQTCNAANNWLPETVAA